MIFYKVWPKVIGGGDSESEVSFFIFFFLGIDFFTQRTGFFHKKWFFIKFDQRKSRVRNPTPSFVFQNVFRLRSYVHERKYFYWIILLIKEMSLVIIHVLLAFLYKWFRLTNNDDRIISMNFHRWLVEASFAPFLAGGY